jgi:CheY-like chemotaxis protein
MGKILIIDDRADVARTIARMLSDYSTTIETDPRSAVARVSSGERFDVVLCDLDMPEMTGREVYDAFPRDNRPRVMLMMSGHSNVAPLFAAGWPVLLKPFRGSELRTLVSALLHKGDDVGRVIDPHPSAS